MKILHLLPALGLAGLGLTSSASAQCLTTFFAANNGLSGAGATVYFDLTANAAFEITGFEINTSTAAGTSIGLEVWTSTSSYDGIELDMSQWTMVAVDDGLGFAAGNNMPSVITLATPFVIPAGTTGVALVGVNTGHRYTDGNGSNQVHANGVLTLEGGSSSGSAFTGLLFNPRVFNGSVCGAPAGAGNTFCDPNTTNSTGLPCEITGTMTAPGGSGLHLEATQGPPSEFGYFLIGTASSDPGIQVSNGFLCLAVGGGNGFGRYNVTGGPFNSVGQFDASGVLQNLPGTSSTGTGFDVPISVPTTGTPQITAGSTWHFQFWYRDGTAGAGTSNFSNGVSVTF